MAASLSLADSIDSAGSNRSITIDGNYAYVAGDSKLKIFDISDPTNITLSGSIDATGGESGVAISGNYAFIASWTGGLTVVNISNKAVPTQAANLTFLDLPVASPITGSGVSDIAISGNYAYLSDYSGSGSYGALRVVDISTPASPTLTATLELGAGMSEIVISGTKAYLTSTNDNRLYIVDISTPASPTLLSDDDTNNGVSKNSVALKDNYAYLQGTNSVKVYDVTDPANIPTDGSEDNINGYFYGSVVSGNYALFPSTDDKLYLFDVSTPSNPFLLDTRDAYPAGTTDIWDVAISNGYAFVAAEDKLLSYKINTPPAITNLNGDSVTTAVDEPVKIDANGNVAITDDGSDFDGSYLTISQTEGGDGAPNGSFTTDGTIAAFLEGDVGVMIGGTPVIIGEVEDDGQGIDPLSIVLNENATLENIGIFLQQLQYEAPTTGTRIFEATIEDGSGSTSEAVSFTVVVGTANSAPTSTDEAVTINEDATYTLTASDFGTYADTESSPLDKVKITTLESAGDLEYSSDGTTWSDVTLNQEITKADIDAGKLRYTPANNANGDDYATIGFKVSDGTDYSSSAYTLTVDVTALNDTPVFGSANTSSKVAVFSYPNLNGTDATPNQNNENANLASIVQKVINDGGAYELDVSIQNFTDNLETKLNDCGFFFMTDMESGGDPANTAFLPDAAKTIIRNWVNDGGVIMMTATAGAKDTTFLNTIFGWDLTTQSGASWDINTANAAGTPFEGGPASLNAPSATDSIGKGTVANFNAIYGTDDNATVATIQYGSGTVIFLGYDYYNSGFSGTGFQATATQYLQDVTNGAERTNAWVIEMIPRALEYSANLSSNTRLIETDTTLTTTGTMAVSDSDSDSVTVSVASVAVSSGTTSVSNATLLSMLSVAPSGNIFGAGQHSGDVTWTFSSGLEAFNALAAGEELVLTYTLAANDGTATANQTLSITIVGTEDTVASAPDPTPTTPPTTTVDGVPVQTGTTTETRTTTDVNGNTVTTTVSTEQLVIAPVSSNRTEQTGNAITADIPLFWGESSRTEWATTASLPTGIGLSTAGTRAPSTTATQQSALADLIYYIDTTTPANDPSKQEMLGGGESFLNALSNIETLVVNKVTLTASTTTASTTPITISGTANTITTTSGAQAPQEALVIDASTLPTGTTLQLNNVEFGVIVGSDLTIRGGEGRNVLFTGAGAQDIMCGADDDELHAGAGDDTVGSAGGNDQIYGEAGNDTVFGGEGSDTLHGGSGTDKATYTGNLSDYTITRDEGYTYVALKSNPAEVDTLVNAESIQFADSTYTITATTNQKQVATLYTQILDRQAEMGGYQNWTHYGVQGDKLGSMVLGFIRSEEYKLKTGVTWDSLDTAGKIEEFYQAILGRASDAGGKQHWINYYNSGATFEQVAEGFVDSIELSGIFQEQTQWNFYL